MPRCKHCKEKFEPARFNQKYCFNPECVRVWIDTEKSKQWKAKKTKLKKELMSLQDYLKIANKYIRLRDKDKGCISCGKALTSKFDAGHFLSVGSYPNLRFNEDNVHGQCVYCNQHQHGNQIEYGLRLPLRISQDAYNRLMNKRGDALKLTLDEIKELIKIYKTKIKEHGKITNN